MYNYKDPLEEKVDEFVEKYQSTLYSKRFRVKNEYGNGIKLCEKGDLSILKAIYNFDVDECSPQWCFRSGKESDINTFHKDSDKKIDDFIVEMMEGVLNAVNNEDESDKYMSYSKCLAIPLFKYYIDSNLIIANLAINSFNINVSVDCFDWCGENDTSWDCYGNEHDRYHQEYLQFPLAIKYMNSKSSMIKKIWDYLEENPGIAYAENDDGSRDFLMDIYNVDFTISGFTLDISKTRRKDFDVYYDKYFADSKWNWFASYKTDREVISTELGAPNYIIYNKDVIQLMRFIYILRIGGLSNEFDNIIENILEDKYTEIFDLNWREKEALKWYSEYLKRDVLENEKKAYIDIFNSYKSDNYTRSYPNQYWEYNEEDGVSKLLSKLEKTHFENSALLEWMKEKANI